MLVVVHCECSRSLLIQVRRDHVGGGKHNSSSWGECYEEFHCQAMLSYLYALRMFTVHSVTIQTLFGSVRLIMDLRFVWGYGNVPISIFIRDSRYSIPWLDHESSTGAKDQPSHLLVDTVQDSDVKYMFPIPQNHLEPAPMLLRPDIGKCSDQLELE